MQARALLYTSTLTNAIMEAMSNMEAAFMDMLAPSPILQEPPHSPPADVGDPKASSTEAPAPVHQALDQFSVSEKQWTQQQQNSNGSISKQGTHASRLLAARIDATELCGQICKTAE